MDAYRKMKIGITPEIFSEAVEDRKENHVQSIGLVTRSISFLGRPSLSTSAST
jgi:hypothetical protein